MVWEWNATVIVGLAVAATGLMSLTWTVISFFLRRDFSDVAALQDMIAKTDESDVLRFALRAALYERLYRFHFPSRRQGLILLLIWLVGIVASFPLSAQDTGARLRNLVPLHWLWLPMLGMMVLIGLLMWFVNSVHFRLKENVFGRAEETHARYRALCFQERSEFLKRTAETPDAPFNLGLKGLLAVLFPARSKR
jgi:hypothetical protein